MIGIILFSITIIAGFTIGLAFGVSVGIGVVEKSEKGKKGGEHE